MEPRELKAHKDALKILNAYPAFKPLNKKNNNLPKPLDGLGRRKNAHATGLLTLSDTHSAFFLYRDGEILTDRAFYGFLFCHLANGSLSPLHEFHWHPSHKGLHCKMPCKTQTNYSGRQLSQAPEFNLSMDRPYDPAVLSDRTHLIRLFCRACGVTMTPQDDTKQHELFQWRQ